MTRIHMEHGGTLDVTGDGIDYVCISTGNTSVEMSITLTREDTWALATALVGAAATRDDES